MKMMTYKEMIKNLVDSIDIYGGNLYGGLPEYGIEMDALNANGELFDDINYAYEELGGSFEDGVDENILYAALDECKKTWMDTWSENRCFYEKWEETIKFEFMEELKEALDEKGKIIYEKIAKEWKEAVGYIADDYDDCLFEIEERFY